MTLYLNGAIFGDGDDIQLVSDKRIVQVGESTGLTALLKNGRSGVTVNFYEVVTPTLRMFTNSNVIQKGDELALKCKVIDEDGSLVKGVTVEFYKEV